MMITVMTMMMMTAMIEGHSGGACQPAEHLGWGGGTLHQVSLFNFIKIRLIYFSFIKIRLIFSVSSKPDYSFQFHQNQIILFSFIKIRLIYFSFITSFSQSHSFPRSSYSSWFSSSLSLTIRFRIWISDQSWSSTTSQWFVISQAHLFPWTTSLILSGAWTMALL